MVLDLKAFHLHCIDHCLMAVGLAKMKLLHFVHMFMCAKMVLNLFCS